MYHVVSRLDYHCPWCEKAKTLLSNNGLEFKSWEVTNQELKTLASLLCFTTIPQIFKDGQRIGGYDDLEKHLGL